MSTSNKLYQTLRIISTNWPIDKLRPTLQLSGAIQSATDRIFSVSPSSSSSSSQTSSINTNTSASMKGGIIDPLTPLPNKEFTQVEIQKLEKMIVSLERIESNAALSTYPMTLKTLEPLSFPKHYKRLREGIKRAEAGQIVERGDTWKNWFRWNQ